MQPRTRRGSNRSILPDPIRAVSYTTALEDFRDALTMAGFDASNYSEHSMKRGGATTAAEAGMPLDDLQLHGGWQSSEVVRRYVDVSVSKRVGLSDMLKRKLY